MEIPEDSFAQSVKSAIYSIEDKIEDSTTVPGKPNSCEDILEKKKESQIKTNHEYDDFSNSRIVRDTQSRTQNNDPLEKGDRIGRMMTLNIQVLLMPVTETVT